MQPAPKSLRLLLLALALVLLGSVIAWYAHTAGGTIAIKDVRFMAGDKQMSGLLYIPAGVSSKQRAPGILAVHGYINSRETQDGFAIEFARRGYVVLAADQAGHGYSDPPAFAGGFGGPAALKFLRSLDIVDPDNIGLEGHSMGGWAVLSAATAYPEDYRSIALVGSSSGTFGTAQGTAEFPRNLGLVFSKYDEFAALMWGAALPPGIVATDKLRTQFGTASDVEIGKLYGSIDAGTARKLYMPGTTHPQDHISTEAIGNTLDWMQLTLRGGKPLPESDQIWYWKEIGTLLAFIGAILGVFPLGALLLRSTFFAELVEPAQPSRGVAGKGWWGAAIGTIAIPVLTYFWLNNLAAKLFPATALFPQTVTSGLMTWAVGNGLITLVLFLAWHFTSNKTATGADYGLTWNAAHAARRSFKSLLLALALVGFVCVLLVAADFLFKIDFRFWVVAIKLMSPLQLRIFLGYLLPFTAFFLVLSLALHGQLRRDGMSLRREMTSNSVLLAAGFLILLSIQYIPLFAGGVMPFGEPLLSIVAFQFLPLLTIVALVSTYFFRKTGHIYVGALFNSVFVTWYIVAGQATHFAF